MKKIFLLAIVIFIKQNCIGQNIGNIINVYTEVTGFSPCNNELIVADASKYNIGDTVLLIQMKGAVIDSTNTANFGTITDYKSSGNYEFNIIREKNGNSIGLLNQLERSYDIPHGKVQLIRVPYYNTVNINSKLTCLPWDGSKGGVLVFNVKGNINMLADIDVSGMGFRHGTPMNSTLTTLNEQSYYYDSYTNQGAEKGEGIYTISANKNYGRGAPANGGGGGNGHNTGGGGGANGGKGGEGGDQWEEGKTITENVGGKGGKALTTNATLNKLYLGGSGGMGQANNLREFPSGNGGGIIIISGGSINSNGYKIKSNGANATEAPNSDECKDGMAGGGGAGTILLDISNIQDIVAVEARGGKGADHIAKNVRHGPGGGGGGGVIAMSQSVTSSRYKINVSGGINGVNVFHNNDPYGATAGTAGIILNNFKPVIDNVIFKRNIDSVTIKVKNFDCKTFDFKGLAFTKAFPVNTWYWDFGDGTTSSTQNSTHIYPTAGSYNVKLLITDVNGCKDSILKIVTPGTINLDKSPDTSLCGSSPVKIYASGGSTYSWFPATGLNNPKISNPIATPIVSTKYFVTVGTGDGCSKTDSITITVNDLPVVQKSNDTMVCRNTQVPLWVKGGSSYNWNPFSTLSNANIANPIATPASNTTYIVKVTNADGCSKIDSVKVNIKPVPQISKSNDTTLCNNTSVKLFVAGGSTYLWSPASSLDNPSSATPFASPLSTTVYKVRITDMQSCVYYDSVKILVRDPAVFSVSPDTNLCAKTPRQLNATGGTSYIWSPAIYLNDATISNPIASPDTSIIYSVKITEDICNESATLFTKLTVLPPANVQASKSNDITCSSPSSHLNATGAQSYTWMPAINLSNSSIADPTATPLVSTTYLVTGTDANGCTGSDTISVKVGFYTNMIYELPNTFTPNGDGLNDCFGVSYWGTLQEFDFSIFNRYGERVFHTNNSANCWDGKYKGNLQHSNAFVYVVHAKTACGVIDKKGTIILLN